MSSHTGTSYERCYKMVVVLLLLTDHWFIAAAVARARRHGHHGHDASRLVPGVGIEALQAVLWCPKIRVGYCGQLINRTRRLVEEDETRRAPAVMLANRSVSFVGDSQRHLISASSRCVRCLATRLLLSIATARVT